MLGFIKLATEVIDGDTNAFDHALLAAVRTAEGMPIGPPWLAEAVRDVTSLGSNVVLGLILLVLVIYFLAVRKRFEAGYLVTAVVVGTLISNVLKIGFNRPRPILPNAPDVFSASFPSGHATMSAVVFLTIGAILARSEKNRRLGAFYIATAIFLTILVGVSRIYLGVHFPTDVVAGWCIGSTWAISCSVVAQRIDKRRASSRVARQRMPWTLDARLGV